MSGDGRVSRRRFLVLAAGSATAVGVGWRLSTRQDADQADPAGERLSRPTPDAASEALGRRYLELVPEEATRDDLTALLPASLATAVPGDEVPAVAAAVRQDFEDGSTIEVDGWLLSLTECRLAAMTVAP